ncbi:hypothetical protein IWZ01DRAFT_553041, partial [Phyllosticta capitalensis]
PSSDKYQHFASFPCTHAGCWQAGRRTHDLLPNRASVGPPSVRAPLLLPLSLSLSSILLQLPHPRRCPCGSTTPPPAALWASSFIYSIGSETRALCLPQTLPIHLPQTVRL